jgi:hypothetical protein
MKNLKTIINECNHTVEFPLMGEIFVVTENRNIIMK